MGAWVPVSLRATWATAGARERAQIPVRETVCSCILKLRRSDERSVRYRCRAYITYAPPGVFLPF